ncbi:MAG: sigma-70 family RNA polymerase sigma factor [Gemmatimonadaceae bacterium]|nr:sigma-70 family RNA polymerase sigma factor [Gemmatimonadaceae bacterium]
MRLHQEPLSAGPGSSARVAPPAGGGELARSSEPPPPRIDPMTVPNDSGASDLQVMSRLIAGDERALGVLYDRHGALAWSLASAIVSDPADAEEVVADAFAQVWRSAATFDANRGSVIAWISTIVRTRSLDLIRSQKRRARVLDQAAAMSDEDASPGLSTPPVLPDREVESSEAQVIVRRALGDLPAAQRLVLELAYFGGLSQSEIAERLGEPLGTVKTRMRSGMEKLRVALGPLMGGRS